MKRILTSILCLSLLISCKDNGDGKLILSDSSGNINNLQVVMSNELWTGEVGEAVRIFFAAPVDGLPQEEPIFTIDQMPHVAFKGFVRNNRTFLNIKIGEEEKVSFATDPFARPQQGVFIRAKTNKAIIKLIEENAPKIIAAFKKTEIKEKQRRIKISLLDLNELKEEMGVSLKVPSVYRIAKREEGFFWIRKDIRTGTVNIVVYEVPMDMINPNSEIINSIIQIRDSIGGMNVTVDDGGRFITEEAYAPYLFKSTIDNKFAYETKGTWEIKNRFMAGPFINFAVKDSVNNRYLILEGFTFAPSLSKRDYQFEVEAILRSAVLN